MITTGYSQDVTTSTLPPVLEDARVRRARDARRVGLVLLALFVLAGAAGLLGTRTVEAEGSGGGYDVTVTHPSVSRSGHAVKLEVQVRREAGFDPSEPVRLRFLSSYFDLFDENGFTPQPDAETSDDRFTYDDFLPPRGDVLTVSVDTRVEPARNTGERGEVAVVDEQGRVLVAVPFRTWLAP
ncbi:MAG: hypothetical protein JWN08_2362 [Frankiales bacterium]|jgi:hypothetical protein|nr:hypothetical protein [Frankiales bacterium]